MSSFNLSTFNVSTFNMTVAASNISDLFAQKISFDWDPDSSADSSTDEPDPLVMKLIAVAVLAFWATMFSSWYLYTYHRSLVREVWTGLKWVGYVGLLFDVLNGARSEVAINTRPMAANFGPLQTAALVAELVYALRQPHPPTLERVGIFVAVCFVFLLLGTPVVLWPTYAVSSWNFLLGQGWSIPKTRDLWAGIGLGWVIWAISTLIV